jgi:6-phosphofructokinase 1
VTTEGSTDSAGISLAGEALAALLQEKIGVPARCDRPGSLARVSQNSVSRVDADEAHLLGSLAVRLSGDGCTGYVVTLQRDLHTADKGEKGYRAVEGTARLDQVSDSARRLPDSWLAPGGTQVSEAFIDWARPLIGGALTEYTALT